MPRHGLVGWGVFGLEKAEGQHCLEQSREFLSHGVRAKAASVKHIRTRTARPITGMRRGKLGSLVLYCGGVLIREDCSDKGLSQQRVFPS